MNLGRDPLELPALRAIATSGPRLALDAACGPQLDAAVAAIERIVEKGDPAYGINTGFGKLAQTRIERAELAHLQENLVLSHAAGVGPPLGDDVVRLVIALKVASLAQGRSGVRRSTLEKLLSLYNERRYPAIPSKGSVGASGDLAPLAHLAMALMPMAFSPKEGLALLNGTQVSTALALCGLFAIENAFAAAVVAGALSVDAAMGSDTPFDPRIHALRGHAGQVDTAAAYRRLLSGSEIRASHLKGDDRVQDPYSLRCQPQVMGACLDVMRGASATLRVEANGVSDNPLVFPDSGEVLSGGNFHAEPVALAADTLALACAEIGALSERRIALLIDGAISRLPHFLVEHGGLNSGFMIAQVTAAALASENKALAHPASVDSLPTSANQEDHVSMATFAARRLADMADNTAGIVAIELLAAAQGVDFRRPRKTSPALQAAMSEIRARVPFYERDRHFAPDIEAIKTLVRAGAFNHHAAELLPSGLMEFYRFRAGRTPLLVSIPHLGTHVPDVMLRHMTPAAAALADTDWHLDLLYTFLEEVGASALMATHSRYVIDLNRPPDDVSLYPGQDTTGLCPLDTGHREPLYAPGAEPTPDDVAERTARYWRPYHAKLAEELARLKAEHGYALLWEAHSIPSVLPRFFEGRLPDFNIGTNRGAACAPGIGDRLLAVARKAKGYSAVLDARFVGGYITRHYGRPAEGIHAVQLELTRCTYMDEDRAPFHFREALARKVRPHVRALVETYLESVRPA